MHSPSTVTRTSNLLAPTSNTLGRIEPRPPIYSYDYRQRTAAPSSRLFPQWDGKNGYSKWATGTVVAQKRIVRSRTQTPERASTSSSLTRSWSAASFASPPSSPILGDNPRQENPWGWSPVKSPGRRRLLTGSGPGGAFPPLGFRPASAVDDSLIPSGGLWPAALSPPASPQRHERSMM